MISTFGDNSGNDYPGTEDNQLKETEPTVNKSTQANLNVTRWAPGDSWTALVRFTGLSNIPSTHTIVRVTLCIEKQTHLGSPGTQTWSIYRSLRNWSEPDSQWQRYSVGNNWAQAGGGGSGTDRAATASAALSMGTTDQVYYTVTSDGLRDDVQGFVNGSYVNNGWWIDRTDGSINDATQITGGTSEDADQDRIYLVVEHALVVSVEPSYNKFPKFLLRAA